VKKGVVAGFGERKERERERRTRKREKKREREMKENRGIFVCLLFC
jgi:hypothetical protein